MNENSDSVIVAALRNFQKNNRKVNIRKINGHFYNGEILALDENHVQIADRMLGPIVVALSEIEEVREWRSSV